MLYLIKSFSYALSGIAIALREERNFCFQWLSGIVVFLLGELLDFDFWQRTIVTMLVFLVLALELHNCAIEKACDGSGKHFNREKKLAKDFAAGSVLLASIAAALIFLSFIENSVDFILERVLTNPVPWIALTLIFLLNLPICFIKTSNHLIILFIISLIINGIFISFSHDQLFFIITGATFHLIFGLAYQQPLSLPKGKNHLNIT
jgi:diacylglycerol kinase